MKRIFTTDDVHPRDRFDYWHDVANAQVTQHDSEPVNAASFSADLYVASLADIDIVSFRTGDMNAWHTLRDARRANVDELFMCRLGAGKIEIEQNGREAEMNAGSVALIDPRLTYSCSLSGNAEMTVFKIPRRELEGRLGDIQQLILHPVAPIAGIHELTSAMLGQVRHSASLLGEHEARLVQNQLLDLVALSLTKATERADKPRISSARSITATRIREAIKSRLADPTLEAHAVAGMAGVTVRHANAILAEEGLSIVRLMIQMRLARCRQALHDPKQAHRTISEIAFSWGFVDVTHFGRRFKAAYGLTPRDYREADVA